MTDRQRWSWLLANRLTLMLVGLVWLGMIFERLARADTPWFLIAMVPAFALFRLAAYLHYRRTGAAQQADSW